jgi:hypothetical protein
MSIPNKINAKALPVNIYSGTFSFKRRIFFSIDQSKIRGSKHHRIPSTKLKFFANLVSELEIIY